MILKAPKLLKSNLSKHLILICTKSHHVADTTTCRIAALDFALSPTRRPVV